MFISMPRRKRHRQIQCPPTNLGFLSIGNSNCQREAIEMNYEEYETIRLNDYLKLNQQDGSQSMNVSRSTYARIYTSARKKIARSFVEGKPILFRGGDVTFKQPMFRCTQCSNWFGNTITEEPPARCEICGSNKFEQFDEHTDYQFNL